MLVTKTIFGLNSLSCNFKLRTSIIDHHHQPPQLDNNSSDDGFFNRGSRCIRGMFFYILFLLLMSFYLYTSTGYNDNESPPHPSLTRNLSWRGVSSLLLPTMPLPPPSLETQDGGGLQLFHTPPLLETRVGGGLQLFHTPPSLKTRVGGVYPPVSCLNDEWCVTTTRRWTGEDEQWQQGSRSRCVSSPGMFFSIFFDY